MTTARVVANPDPPLYGRGAELDRLREAIDVAREGRGTSLSIEGEAGIGKTRLLRAALDEARAKGLTVLSGAAFELERGRAFGLLAEALALSPRSPDPRRAAIGQLLTREVAHDAPTPDLGFQISEDILELLDHLAATPVVVALEDLHWADPSSIGVLASAARRFAEQPLVLLLTARPIPRQPDLDRLVDALMRGGGMRLPLDSLSPEEVEGLAGHVAGAPPGPRLRAELAGAAGNPLYVMELVNAFREDAVLDTVDGEAEIRVGGLPTTLRLTILRRLSALPEATVAVLRICAVLGPTIPLRQLAEIHGRTIVQLLPDLEPAVRAGVLENAGDDLAFRHELIRAAIYEDLPSAVRRELHHEVAGMLERSGAPPVVVAGHVARGAGPGDPRAVEVLRRAARDAAPRSPTIAIDLLYQALDVASDDHPEREVIRADLAPLLVLAGRIDDAEAVANDLLSRELKPTSEVRLRVGLAHVLVRRGRWRAARTQILRAAERMPDPGRALVLAPASYIAFIMGEVEQAEAEARAALTAAESLDNPVVASTALMTLAGVADTRGDPQQAVDAARRSAEEAARAEALFSGFLFPELMLGAALMGADQLTEADQVLRAGIRRAETSGSVSQLPYYHAARSMCLFHAGDWDDALTEAETCLTLSQEVGTRWRLPAATVAGRIRLARDDLPGVRALLAGTEVDLAGEAAVLLADGMGWVEALVLEAEGAPPQEVAGVMAAAWDLLPDLRFSFGRRVTAVDAVRIAIAAGDRDQAAGVVATLEEFARRPEAVASSRAAALHVRGLLAGDAGILVDAATAYADSPRPAERAWAAEDAALALATAGSKTAARPWFEVAVTIFDGLGARRETARVLASMRRVGMRRGVGGKRGEPRTGWDALTPAEHRVAALVAEGLTNAQMAARLYVSRHTIESHLKHIFAKLDLSSRSELAVAHIRRQSRRDA